MRIDRRTLLKGLGGSLLAPGCAGRLPPTFSPALLRDRIRTVVVLMMENRSFDHMFGSLSLLEGRTDVDGLLPGMSNALADGTEVPIALADAPCILDPDHSWDGGRRQWDGGACDGFARVHESRYGAGEAHRVMGYLDRSMAPASYQLADRFALCQRWFCSVMGPTWPNRYYALFASSDGRTGNDLIEEQSLPSIYTRLDEAFIPWAEYYGNLPFSMIFPGHSLEQSEYQRLDAFFDAAAAGTLPPFVHLDPIYGMNDDHPPEHAMAGQILISAVYAALAQSPQWPQCMLVITYDEHGGFFDHVSPPQTADARPEFRQLGFRVPGLVIGPYVSPQVSSTVFDHTSVIASVLRQHELDPLNERDDAANDLWSLCDRERLLAGQWEPAPALDPIAVTDDEIYAIEGCTSSLGAIDFHRAPGTWPATQQPELEAFADQHPSAGDGRRDGPAAWARIVARARALGAVR
ncbi:MAG: hypothetical protein A2138_14070 [Deltaproteobacteria bacterium RBG_16_71_12]|nr:MAG: hypothetical protein A2138_14070 [Deltaproteobacteria bacterium RBG_16_71_12]